MEVLGVKVSWFPQVHLNWSLHIAQPRADASFGLVLDQALRPHRELKSVTRSFFVSVFCVVRAFTTCEIFPERAEGLARDKTKVHSGKL